MKGCLWQRLGETASGGGGEMARLRLIEGRGRKRVLIYGMRLFEPGMVAKVRRAEVLMSDGRVGRITLHVIEGSIPQIKKQLARSIDAFFDLQNEMK
jgi:hypothetical protein